MSEMTISEARASLAEAIDTVRVEQEPLYLTRRGKRVAAIVDNALLDMLLEAAEDLEDIRTAEAAKKDLAEGKEELIPWEEVKKDLGLEL